MSQSVSQYQYGAHGRCVEDGEERVEGVEERKEEPLPTSPTLPWHAVPHSAHYHKERSELRKPQPPSVQ